MKYFRKIWVIIFWMVMLSLNYGFWWLWNWGARNPIFTWTSTPIVDEKEIVDINSWSKSFSDKLEWILSIPKKSEYSTSLWYVTTLIQVLINWLLWILSFVALVYMLYCGFLVFSSGSDDKNASKGKKWILTAAIALAWIWLSWLVISAMIRFINNIA